MAQLQQNQTSMNSVNQVGDIGRIAAQKPDELWPSPLFASQGVRVAFAAGICVFGAFMFLADKHCAGLQLSACVSALSGGGP